MLKELGELYRGVGAYARACPWLFMLPVGVEFIQHVGEVSIGMYDGYAQAEAVGAHPLRTGLGFAKTVALIVSTYWVIRFLQAGPAQAANGNAFRTFAPVFAWSVAWSAAGLWGGNVLAAAGVPAEALMPIGLGTFLGLFLFELGLAAWKSAAAIGDGRIGFARSLTLSRGSWLWALGFTLAAVLPPMVLHHALNLGAIGRTPAMVWTLLVLDSLLVGYLAALLAGTNLFIARRVAARAGLTLEAQAPAGPELRPALG